MRQNHRVLVITTITFGLYYVINKFYFHDLDEYLTNRTGIRLMGYFLSYIIVGFPMFLGLFITHKPGEILNSLGLRYGFFKGFLIALIVTLPMLIGYSIFLKFNEDLSINWIFIGSIFAALFEEIYFRGILFGQVFRFTRIGFIPSVAIGALIFALGHLWQSTDVSVLTGIFIITFLGAGLFAWLYIEWDNNLWVPIGLHLFMNLYWELFSGTNALGGKYENMFRIITIISVIAGTLLYKKYKGLKLEINRSNLLIKAVHNKLS
jgi:membrane protease YdiL (CAAX protease family)